MKENKCTYRISGDTWRHVRTCSRNALPGTKFCKQHSPEARKARAEASQRTFDLRWDTSEAKRKMHQAALVYAKEFAPADSEFRKAEAEYLRLIAGEEK